MKQFELKFYREWYDALSELSHDDRAAAALALLEYVYEGKIPQDQFIRIVTTLMRNKIDREKASFTARRSKRHGICPVSEPAGSLSPASSTSSMTPNPHISTVENAASVVEPSDETSSSLDVPLADTDAVLLSDTEAAEKGIDDPEPVNQILKTHFNPRDWSFRSLCAENGADPISVAKNAKRLILQWIGFKTWHPVPLPPRPKPSILNQIDSYAFSAAKASHSSPPPSIDS